MEIKVFNNNSMATNTYIVSIGSEALIIDPVGNLETINYYIKNKELNVKYILLTHGHGDHIGLVTELKELSNALVYIHNEDEEMINNSSLNLSSHFGKAISFKSDFHYKDGDELLLGTETIKIIHTPGHSKGSVCIQIQDCLFTGDTIFQGSVGRTDLYGGDYDKMLKSIEKISKLDSNLKIYPGHGPSSQLSIEIRTNPYFNN